MLFRKREDDIEMSGMISVPTGQEQQKTKKKEQEPLDETDYVPFDWKRFFLAPKYIRTLMLKYLPLMGITNNSYSVAYPVSSDRHCNSAHNDQAR